MIQTPDDREVTPPRPSSPLSRDTCVADHGEPQHHDLQPGDLEARYVDVREIEARYRHELDDGEQRGQDHPVRPSQEARVETGRADGLGLGSHVGGQQDPHESQHTEVRVAPVSAERNTADHEHVGVPVEDVVQVVPLGAGLAGQLGHLAVQGVEVPGHYDHQGPDKQEPCAVRIAAEIEDRSAQQREDQPDPRYRVRIDVDKLPRDRGQREVDPRPLSV